MLLRGLRNPQAYAAGRSLYVSQDVTPPADAAHGVITQLMRVDPVSGHVLASRRIAGQFSQELVADHSLWVMTSAFARHQRSNYRLLRLDPRSLAVRSRTILPASRPVVELGSLAFADNRLWVGAATLDQVSLVTGRVVRVIKLPYRGPVQVAADRNGRVLLASLGLEHPTYIARLNPRTGAVTARSTILWSVVQPMIDGIDAGGAWIDNSGGMTTTSWRISLRTLKPTRTHVPAVPGLRVLATTIDGILWVTKPEHGHEITYCANPVTGRLRAHLRFLRDALLLTAQGTSLYYSPAPSRTGSTVRRAAIDPRCAA